MTTGSPPRLLFGVCTSSCAVSLQDPESCPVEGDNGRVDRLHEARAVGQQYPRGARGGSIASQRGLRLLPAGMALQVPASHPGPFHTPPPPLPQPRAAHARL